MFRILFLFLLIGIRCIGQNAEPEPTAKDYKDQSMSRLRTILDVSRYDLRRFKKIVLTKNNQFIDTVDVKIFQKKQPDVKKLQHWICDSIGNKSQNCYSDMMTWNQVIKTDLLEFNDFKLELKGNEIKASKYHERSGGQSEHYFTFNLMGLLVNKKLYSRNAADKDFALLQSVTYQYETDRLKLKLDSIFNDRVYGKSIGLIMAHHYDSNGSLVKLISTQYSRNGLVESESSTDYNYNADGNVISTSTKSTFRNYNSSIEYKLNRIIILGSYDSGLTPEFEYQFL